MYGVNVWVQGHALASEWWQCGRLDTIFLFFIFLFFFSCTFHLLWLMFDDGIVDDFFLYYSSSSFIIHNTSQNGFLCLLRPSTIRNVTGETSEQSWNNRSTYQNTYTTQLTTPHSIALTQYINVQECWYEIEQMSQTCFNSILNWVGSPQKKAKKKWQKFICGDLLIVSSQFRAGIGHQFGPLSFFFWVINCLPI